MKKNLLIITLVTSVLLTSTMFSGIATKNEPDINKNLVVLKEVWDGEDWVDYYEAEIGETVTFRINVTYHNTTVGSHWAEEIYVYDTLPICLEYEADPDNPNQPTEVVGKKITWYLGSTILYDDDYYVIEFNATVVSYGENINLAEAEAYEHCCSRIIYGEDIATVFIPLPEPEIDIEKKVWDGCQWVEEIYEYPGEDVKFKLTIENTGNIDLQNVNITDKLPGSLDYADNANIPPDYVSPDNKMVCWELGTLEIDETVEITFYATVVGFPCSDDIINWATATGEDVCQQEVEDEDSAKVYVYGMCMEKEVQQESGGWVEETTVNVGTEGTFRIRVHYYGENTLKLYDIRVKDVLPPCLDYVEDSSIIIVHKTTDYTYYVEPEMSGDGKTLWWNLTENEYALKHTEWLEIIFKVTVNGGTCDPCVNWAYVHAIECGIREWEWEDPATIIPFCGLTAKIEDGPYYGEIGEEITLTGSASGGTSPYTFKWDLDDDEVYDDATGPTVSWTWSEPGAHPIRLKVIDAALDDDTDDSTVHIEEPENNPPYKPQPPTGNARGGAGNSYTYTGVTTDPEGDKIQYQFDWDDGSLSPWTTLVASGTAGTASHTWASQGTYDVKVRAKDEHGAESDWSEGFPVKMPKTKNVYKNPLFMELLGKLINRFPMLRFLLGF